MNVHIILRVEIIENQCGGFFPHIRFEGRVRGDTTVGIDGGKRRGGSSYEVVGALVSDYMRQGKRPRIQSVRWDSDITTQNYARTSSAEQNSYPDVWTK